MRIEAFSALLRRCSVVIAIVSCGCDHSAPYVVPDYGGGPRFEPGASLDGATGSVSWTGDGAGLLYVGACLVPETVLGRHPAPALIVLPTNGGRPWERCGRQLSLVFPNDSSQRYSAASLAAGGHLIYEESVSPPDGSGFTVFPAFTNTVLWLTDSAYPSPRRKLLALTRRLRRCRAGSRQCGKLVAGHPLGERYDLRRVGRESPGSAGRVLPGSDRPGSRLDRQILSIIGYHRRHCRCARVLARRRRPSGRVCARCADRRTGPGRRRHSHCCCDTTRSDRPASGGYFLQRPDLSVADFGNAGFGYRAIHVLDVIAIDGNGHTIAIRAGNGQRGENLSTIERRAG